jgi:hypothetical protein
MRSALTLALCALLSIPLSIAARATSMKPISLTHYDGVYSVEITTSEGSCGKVYRGSVTVSNGRIANISDPGASASGLIEDDGTVSLTFRTNDQIAHVGGRIWAGHGRGPWSSPTAECGGWWHAERQG